MTAKKILTVFGATGTQGGSVVKSILGDPKTASEFTIRAVTRDASKPAAQKLVESGAEVVTVRTWASLYHISPKSVKSTDRL
jgi:uncharacterized protein YbjT (DUF2867 family)